MDTHPNVDILVEETRAYLQVLSDQKQRLSQIETQINQLDQERYGLEHKAREAESRLRTAWDEYFRAAPRILNL